jgi:hypothetical protein
MERHYECFFLDRGKPMSEVENKQSVSPPDFGEKIAKNLVLISEKVKTMSNQDLEKIFYHITEIESLLKPPKELEIISLKKELTRILQPRFNNYKNGTMKDNVVMRPPATLKVHYKHQLTQRVKNMITMFLKEDKIHCCGISSPTNPISKCSKYSHIDPRHLNLHQFTLDHYIEQDSINKSMENCLRLLVVHKKEEVDEFQKKEGKSEEEIISFLKRNFKEPPKTYLQVNVFNFINNNIDLNLYKLDLYGENLYFRCVDCNKESKSRKKHPNISETRYLIAMKPST